MCVHVGKMLNRLLFFGFIVPLLYNKYLYPFCYMYNIYKGNCAIHFRVDLYDSTVGRLLVHGSLIVCVCMCICVYGYYDLVELKVN